MFYIGIDLGTSAMKLLLLDEKGVIHHSVSKEYPLSFPHPGWSEQEPAFWWNACVEGIRELIQPIDAHQVAGIGCGGQMHGLVILDDKDAVIRPAILWNDGRTFEEVNYLNETVGKDKLSSWTSNIAFAGFTAPKILWIYRNEPDNFKKIKKIMLPKDYLNFRLTGVHCTDYSDASGMLLLDVKNKCYSKEMLSICHIEEKMLPMLFESYEPVGTLLPEVAQQLGLPTSVVVVAGAGDNAAAAVGTGTVGDGHCNISLGTSGTIFISSKQFGVDPNNALHSFAHADGHYHLMGCMLSAASCNKWFCEDILKTSDFVSEQAPITLNKLGKNSVFYLPYLMGERSPINDTDARSMFIGMSMDTTRADLMQAVFEGVSFAIRDSLEIARSLGNCITQSTVCGGGAKSPLWKTILSNVLNVRLDLPCSVEGPGYGGAMLAMVGTKQYASVEECASQLIHISGSILPDKDLVEKYDERYQKFKKIYPSVKNLFRELSSHS